MKVEILKSTISIIGLNPTQAQQIKMAEVNLSRKNLITSHEENHFCFQLIQDINEAQTNAVKRREWQGILVNTKSGLIDIPGMTPREAFHIKTALNYLTKVNISGTTIDDRAFVDQLIFSLEQAQTECFKTTQEQTVCA